MGALQEHHSLTADELVSLETSGQAGGHAPLACPFRWPHETFAPSCCWMADKSLGVEALVVMKDVCKLSDEEALATLEWTAQTLLRASLENAAPKSVRSNG